MERLTEHYGSYIAVGGTKSLYPGKERKTSPLSNCIVRLAAYEDLFERLGLDITDPAQVEELTALVKARDEGRIKVGDRVKVDVRTWGNVWNFKTIENGKFLVGEVVSIIQTKRQLLMKIRVEHNVSWKRPMKRYPVSALGITVFPTRAEAEAALGGGGNGS